ncbi:MAG: hypothetical protein ABR986_10040 [Methanomassiliicoccales archaeon]|jgi:hypothetical protein
MFHNKNGFAGLIFLMLLVVVVVLVLHFDTLSWVWGELSKLFHLGILPG